VQQGAKLVPSDAVGPANFGDSVALSADGNTALIGGLADNTVQGAAWVFTLSAGVWSQQGAKLVPSGAIGYPRVGSAVALSSDGNTALIGGETDNNLIGAAWVFTRSGSTWSQQGNKLVGSGSSGTPEEGFAVALSSNGDTALIGGPFDNSFVGAAWVFARSGATWTQQGAKLVGTGAVGTAIQGYSVALSGDGATALLGGTEDDNSGAVWVFTLSGSVWSQQGNMLVGSPGQGSQGTSAALSTNGNIALSGGGNEFFVFTRSAGAWTQQGTPLFGSGSSGYSAQGSSVALSPTTNAAYTAITGGPADAAATGAVWVFAVPVLTVLAPASAEGDTAFNITVDAEDSAGAFVTGYDDLLHFTSTDGAAILPANSTLTNGSGLFAVTLLTAGNQTITATDTVYPSITATSGTVLVNSTPQPPTLSKAFGAASIPLNNSTTLVFTVTNPNAALNLTGIGFTDTLPSGLGVTTSAGLRAKPRGLPGTCNGTITASGGGVSLSGATLLSNTSCTFSVNVTGTTAGAKNNVTSAVTSNEAGSGNTAAATLIVVAPPSIAKAFGAQNIPLNGTTSLTLTLTNPVANTVTLTGVAFTDMFPAGLQVATPSGIANTCGGTATAVAGSGTVSLAGATIAASSSCTLSVNVTATASGLFANTTAAVTSTNGGTGNTGTANLAVASPPTISKTFGAASIPLNGSTSLGFVLTNPAANSIPLTGVAFTDSLPAGLVVASPSGLTGTCGGTETAVPGGTSVTLSGATLAASATCTLSLNVTGVTAGVKNNSVMATSVEGGNSGTSNASLTVTAPPTIAKAFGRPSIPLNSPTTLTFTVGNPNTASALSGVAFSDSMPAGLLVATPNGLTGACGAGTITAVAGSGSVSLTAATLAASSSCSFSVNVTATTAGAKNNVTSKVTSNEGGSGLAALASLIVVAPPSIAKAFGALDIPLNGTTSLTLTLTNPVANTVALTGVAFTDTFPAGLQVATPNGLASTCGGTATAVAGSGTVSLAGAAIAASSSCTLSVNVTGTVSGAHTNTTAAVTSTDGGTGNTATAILTVASPPTISKTFGAARIAMNGSTSLGFVVTNPASNTIPLTGVAFTDNFPAGLVVASPSGLTGTCGGTSMAVPGGTSVILSEATLAANTSCTLSLNVTAVTAGTKNNSVMATSIEGGNGNTSNASLTVLSPPTIAKAFGRPSIPLNGPTTLTFTVGNPNTASALSGVAFSDSMPAGLLVATPNGLTGACGAGTITAVAGSGSVSLTGATLAASSSCSFSVNVTGTTAGGKSNITSAVTSNEGGAGLPALARLIVVAPPSIAKAFGAPAIPLNGTTSLTLTLTNRAANTVALTGVAVTDTFPAGLQVATPNGLANTCGGTATAVAGSGTVSLTGASVAVASSCTVTVNVTGTVSGAHTNTAAAVTSTNGGTGNTATARLTVASPPVISKAFGAASISLGGSTSLGFVLTNPASNTIPLTGVAFTDNLPAGLVVASPSGLTGTCGGTETAVLGGTSVSLSGATLAANTSCTISLNVTGVTTGTQNNSVTVTSIEAGNGNTSNASLTVLSPPTIQKVFGEEPSALRTRKPLASPKGRGAPSIPVNGSILLTFFIGNPNATSALTGVAVTDALPSGLVVATPNGLTGVCGAGTITAVAGSGSVSLAGATLTANGACNFSVNVTGTTAGVKNNVTSAVTSNEGGTGLPASASLTVVAPPSIAKTFGAQDIPLNGTTSLTLTLTNPVANTVALTEVAFTDTFPAGLQVATPDGLVNSCGGTATAVAGSGTVGLTGASVAAASSCTLTVNVTGTVSGAHTNTTAAVTSTNGGTGNTAAANLAVASPPVISKAFGAASIPLNGSTSLGFVLTNPAANTIPLTGVAFTDNLPAGLVVASPSGLTGTCGGTETAVLGGTSVTLSGATLAASATCTLSLNVTGVTAGTQNNTVTVTSIEGGNGNTSTASLVVLAPPAILSAFGAASIPLNGTTTLTFNLSNPNPALALTGVAFTDALGTGLIVASPSGLTNTCAGTPVAVAGSGSVSLSGAAVAANSSCSFSVNVTGTTAGTKNNVTSALTSNQGATGLPASASLTVVAPPSIAKIFGAPHIVVNGITSLTLTLANPAANTVALTGVSFTDIFPPGLSVAAVSGIANTCGGTASAVAGSGTVGLSGATIAVASSCSLSVNVTAPTSGAYTNTTAAVTSTNGGAGSTASATLAVAAPPAIAKAFGAASIPLNGSTSLTFTLVNPGSNTIPLTGVAFIDSLPAGLAVASPVGLTNTCGGTVAAGGTSVSLSGASLAVNTSCMLSLNVTGVTAGTQNNSVTVTSTEGGNGNTSTASLVVLAPPAIAKAFGAASIPLNGTTTLTFTLSNPNPALVLTGVAFTDTLGTGLIVASPSGLTGTCGAGTITAIAGSGSLSLSGATLAAAASCSFSVNVTGTTAGTKNNVTSVVTSNQGGTGLAASATLTVVAPPSLAESLATPSIPVNGVTSLTYTVVNPAVNTVALTGVAFTDNFPPDMLVATPNGLSNTCGGTAAAASGSGIVSLSGAVIAAGRSCTLTVNITVTAAMPYTTGPTTVVSANGGTGNTTSAPLNVLVPITFNTVPAGLAILVDGTSFASGRTLQLLVDSTHTISAVTPQPGTPGTQYLFGNWSDGGSLTHTITVPVAPTTYTATFTTQYQLTLAVTPTGSGTVTPVSGGFYDAGASVSVTAAANAGYVFKAWTGAANPPGNATAAVVMSAPESITASFQPAGPAPPVIGGVLNGASFQQSLAAPNTILSLFGSNLSCVPAPQVLVNGVQTQVLFASNTQINFVTPASLGSVGSASVQVVCNGVTSQPDALALSPVNPAIFTLTENGTGQGAVLNLNYSVNGTLSPASLGGYIFVYVTGFGDLGSAGADGLQRLTLPVTALIGGIAAQVVYAGEAPGFTIGLQQINVLIPENAPVGSAVPIQLVVDDVSTPSGVTIVIQ
jgi:hypothetical protein